MKCLDQGVDIPCLTNAIFLSSSGSELEHIQRAGRLVRKSPSKPEIVNIYDIIILPSDSQLIFDKENGTNYCAKIFNMEEKRIEFFSDLAQNSTEVPAVVADSFHFECKHEQHQPYLQALV